MAGAGARDDRPAPDRWLERADRLFGTRHLPDGARPDRYGIADDPVPEGFVDQLLYPLRSTRAGG